MKSKSRILLILLLVLFLLIGIPVIRFVFANLKAGYDQAQRDRATRPAATKPMEIGQKGVDFGGLDFAKNDIDVHNRTDHFAQSLPAINGSARDGSISGMVQQGKFEIRGTVAEVNGATRMRLPSGSHSGGNVTVELVVEQGTVRAYLGGLNGSVVSGNVFVDASPGQPGRVNGYLDDWSDTGSPEQDFILESRDAPAKGVSYRVYR